MIRSILSVAVMAWRYRNGLERLFIWIARFGYLCYLLYGAIEWFRPGALEERLRRRRTLLYCLFAVSLGSAVSWCIGHVWHRPRPFAARKEIVPAIPHEENASFPSNHAMNSLAIAAVMCWRRSWFGLPFLVGTVLLSASRLVCRLHYRSDILGGWILGLISAAAVVRSQAAARTATQILRLYDITVYMGRQWRRFW